MKNITQFIEDLLLAERQLEDLSRQYEDLYKNYAGDEFLEQKFLATNTLDNLILAVTHENASVIGFQRQAILDLCQFITFRKSYPLFDDKDLSLIIDKSDLSAQEKLILLKKHTNIVDLESIKMQWDQLFNNKNYRQVKTYLKI